MRHLSTAKHKILTHTDAKSSEYSGLSYLCECGKMYKHRQSLFNHKKICFEKEKKDEKDEKDKKDKKDKDVLTDTSNNYIMVELLKQNKEFKDLIVEQNKHLLDLSGKMKNGHTIHHTTNHHTNHFNLHVFLHEQCKDALNLMEFVNTIKLQLSDLDMMGKLGYIEGISKIFIRGLKELDIFKRPIHCSDLKRETLYVKDKDAWKKDDGENVKIKQAINMIANQNIKQLPVWVKENPTAEDTETQKHMDYIHIVHESMGGSSLESEEKKHNKIIRNVAKEVLIDKMYHI